MIDIDEADQQATQAQAWVVRYMGNHVAPHSLNLERFFRMLDYRDVFKEFLLTEPPLVTHHNFHPLSNHCHIIRHVITTLHPISPPPASQLKELLIRTAQQFMSVAEAPLFEEKPLSSLEWMRWHNQLVKSAKPIAPPPPPGQKMITVHSRSGHTMKVPEDLLNRIKNKKR